jgi:hypothetical protein
MVKYFFLKGQGSKLMHNEFVSTLQDNAISLFTLKNWLRRLKPEDRSCGDEERLGRPLISLVRLFSTFEEVSFRECSSNGRTCLGGSGHDQEFS